MDKFRNYYSYPSRRKRLMGPDGDDDPRGDRFKNTDEKKKSTGLGDGLNGPAGIFPGDGG